MRPLNVSFTPLPPGRARTSGFTLLELLIILVIIGILVSVGAVLLNRWQRNLAAETYVQTLTSDMNLTRSRAMATGTTYRLVLNSGSQYVIQRNDSGTWTTVSTRNATNSSVANSGAKVFQYDTRGFITATDASGTATVNTNLTATLANGQTRTVIVTALGTARAF